MRAIFEAMGATVEWEDTTKTITATKDKTTIVMQIGNKIITTGEKQIELDVEPQILNGRTLVPVRAVAESLNAKVNWDSESQTVIIEK